MSQRQYQEEKFKNIVIRFQPPLDLNASINTKNGSGHGHNNRFRPTTPKNHEKSYNNQEYNELDFDIKTQSYTHNNGNQHVITFSPKKQDHYPSKNIYEMDNENQKNHKKRSENHSNNNDFNNPYLFQQQLRQKDEIIQQLKNIIKASYQNNSKFNAKNSLVSDRSVKKDKMMQQDYQEIKQLRHNVKVLTIQNNALSDYIDKLKREIDIKFPLESNRSQLYQSREKKQSQTRHEEYMDELKRQNEKLHETILEKQRVYEKKIDQFIISHKSLASQCKNIEEQRNFYEQQNQRLSKIIKQMEQSQVVGHKKSQNKDQTAQKPHNGEKYSIIKIKEQYMQSLKQMKQTMQIQVQDLLQNFNSTFLTIHKQINYYQNRINKLENNIRFISKMKLSQSFLTNKKSQIYIEEGMENLDSNGSQRKNQRETRYEFSRIIEDNHGQIQRIYFLEEQNTKLRQIISNLQNQSSKRQAYTFRSREYEHSPSSLSTFRLESKKQDEHTRKAKRQTQSIEKELIKQINILKTSIADVEYIYQQQKEQIASNHSTQMLNLQHKIHQFQTEIKRLKSKYDEVLAKGYFEVQSMQVYKSQIQHLKQENSSNMAKIQKYKRLHQILKEETEEIGINYQLFANIKKQLQDIRQKYQNNKQKFLILQKENKEILQANAELKSKYESSQQKKAKLQKQNEILKQQASTLKTQRQKLIFQINMLQNSIKLLQSQNKIKKESLANLLNEKTILENQLINYLSIFNKCNFIESKNKQSEELQFENLFQKIQKIQLSIFQINSSKKSKREIINKIINEELSIIPVNSKRQ